MSAGAVARRLGVRIKVGPGKRVRPNDSIPGEVPIRHESDRYNVMLSFQGRTMKLRFFKGIGNNGSPPTLDEVMESLVSDLSFGGDYASFGEWADEVGVEAGSIAQAEIGYKALVKQNLRFIGLMGANLDVIMEASDD